MVAAALRGSYETVEARDYLAGRGGYRAYHLLLRWTDGLVKEIQLMTHNQHVFADLAHDAYKPKTPEQRAALSKDRSVVDEYYEALGDYLCKSTTARPPGHRFARPRCSVCSTATSRARAGPSTPRRSVLSTSDIERAAELLLQARADGEPLAVDGLDWAPQGNDDAYAVQALVQRELGLVGAWKVGARSADDPSSYAPIPLSGVHPSGVTLPDEEFPLRGIEVEFAYRLGTDLPAREGGYSAAEVTDAVESVLPVIEIVESRLVDRAAAGASWALADHQSHGALVLGPAHVDWRTLEVATPHVSIAFGDEVVLDRECRNAAGDPFGQVAALANLAVRHCGGLRRGQVITTGSLMGVIYAPSGSRVTALVRGLGPIEVEFGTPTD